MKKYVDGKYIEMTEEEIANTPKEDMIIVEPTILERIEAPGMTYEQMNNAFQNLVRQEIHYRLRTGTFRSTEAINAYNNQQKQKELPTGEFSQKNAEDDSFFSSDFGKDLFKTKDYQKKFKTNVKEATLALNILYFLGVIDRVGKEGKAYLYQNR